MFLIKRNQNELCKTGFVISDKNYLYLTQNRIILSLRKFWSSQAYSNQTFYAFDITFKTRCFILKI